MKVNGKFTAVCLCLCLTLFVFGCAEKTTENYYPSTSPSINVNTENPENNNKPVITDAPEYAGLQEEGNEDGYGEFVVVNPD